MALHLRITTSDYTTEQVENFVKTLSEKYIVAHEKKPYSHYHCHFEYNVDKFTQYARRKLGKSIAEHFDIKGNKQYSLTIDKGKSSIYTLKEGNFVYLGYTEDEIKILQEQSTSKESYTDGLKDINEEYLGNPDKTFSDYTNEYVSYMLKHNKNISKFRLESIFTTKYLQKESHNVKHFCSSNFQHISKRYTENWQFNYQCQEHCALNAQDKNS